MLVFFFFYVCALVWDLCFQQYTLFVLVFEVFGFQKFQKEFKLVNCRMTEVKSSKN